MTFLDTLAAREIAELRLLESLQHNADMEARLLESWGSQVDMSDARQFDQTVQCGTIPVPAHGQGAECIAYKTEFELDRCRWHCRELATENEAAKSAHKNRISYIVGTGHVYGIKAKQGKLAETLKVKATAIIEAWQKSAKWAARQKENLLRCDRDGECFLRLFPVSIEAGLLAVRYIEPDRIRQPPDRATDNDHSWGIHTETDDVETVLGYWVLGADNLHSDYVPAAEIQHRKFNVEMTSKRGLMTLWPVRKELERIQKLRRNMSVLGQTQSAIACVRQHEGGAAGVATFVAGQATKIATNPQGQPTYTKKLEPGSILDAPKGVTYTFPTALVDGSKLVSILQADLRAVASCLVMPESMLSQDASNNNFASALVAEGPAAKNFQCEQQSMIELDLPILEMVLDRAVVLGLLSQEERDSICVTAEAPTVMIRNGLADAQENEIKVRNGVLSTETWQLQCGLEPEQEQERIERQNARNESNAQLSRAPVEGEPDATDPKAKEQDDEQPKQGTGSGKAGGKGTDERGV